MSEQSSELTELSKRISNLENVCTIQSTPGNYDQSEYMRGLANGLRLALAIMKNQEPQYFNPNEEISEWKQ